MVVSGRGERSYDARTIGPEVVYQVFRLFIFCLLSLRASVGSAHLMYLVITPKLLKPWV